MQRYKRRSSTLSIDTPGMVLTPLTDMALILLIIFMVAAIPLASKLEEAEKEHADLHVSTAHSTDQASAAIIDIRKKQGKIVMLINGKEFDVTKNFTESLASIIGGQSDQAVTLNVDNDVNFDAIIQILYDVQAVPGITSIALGSQEV